MFEKFAGSMVYCGGYILLREERMGECLKQDGLVETQGMPFSSAEDVVS